MHEKSLFSVLIANYNNGRFLMDAIESVRCQTYENWEIILVDDGSTDNSQELYKQLETDTRIHIYYNKENKGCGYTKRRCVELAQGDLCGFLDPDDTLEHNAIEIMHAEHRKYPDVSMVYSRYYYSDLDLNKIGISEHQKALPENMSFLEYGQGAISHFVSFKKTSYDKTPGIDLRYKRAVDHALYYLLEEAGKLHFIDMPLYNYREGTGSNISTRANADVAFLWHLIVKADACNRRGLLLEELIYPEFLSYLNDGKADAFIMGQDKVRGSRTYRLGRMILLPIKWMKDL